MNLTDKALKVLMRNKRVPVACYTPVQTYGDVNLDTGERILRYSIRTTTGAVLSTQEVRSFVKDNIVVNANTSWLLLEEKAVLEDSFSIYGVVYDVKQVFDSFYGGWHLIMMEKIHGEDITQEEIRPFVVSDRVRIFLDMLCVDIKEHYGYVVPDDVMVWPICGFDLATSLRRLYPVGTFVQASGDVTYIELGRKAGYDGFGTVDGSFTKRARDMTQTNKPELQPYIDKFNERLGRM